MAQLSSKVLSHYCISHYHNTIYKTIIAHVYENREIIITRVRETLPNNGPHNNLSWGRFFTKILAFLDAVWVGFVTYDAYENGSLLIYSHWTHLSRFGCLIVTLVQAA